jgi:hypothetical protein
MALVTCGECLKQYSNQAKACIHCGGKTLKPATSNTVKLLSGFLLVCIAAGMVKESLKPNADPQIAIDQKEKSLAMATCQIAFEKEAHNPESISWIRDQRVAIFQVNTDGTQDRTTIFTSQPVRAKNKLGALVKSNVACTVINQNGRWNVVKIKAR